MHIFIVTRGYPSAERLYNHAFVHRRVLAYRERGHRVTVIWLHRRPPQAEYEFDGVPVLMRTADDCVEVIRQQRPDVVALHAPADDFAPVIENVPLDIPVNGWIYGSEIMPFYEVTERREHNEKRWLKAKAVFERRIAYWRRLAADWPANFRMVFVSQFAADEAFRAVGRELPRWTVSPSPVDTELFRYSEKQADDRFKVLSIRPFSDWRYANDLSVEAILLLAEKPGFDRFHFHILGEGYLFEEILAPIRHLPNVRVEQRFLTQFDVAKMHQAAGIFLCPTRNDAQGVTRDEAMSSGLVPVTNAAGAVPEFADESCAWLALPEESGTIARGLQALADDPALFLRLSSAAARRVRARLSIGKIVAHEEVLMKS
ncbi:glycosyltransferase family 4 protein [Alteraurantiacibacter aquimixticola]|nr:glycosyltransferase family 4 protein [Alteraurantiacibacter aquimixticola]